MTQRILSVSYDVSLLATRQLMLELKGYQVTSALGFTDALQHCKNGGFDLFILVIQSQSKTNKRSSRLSKKNAPHRFCLSNAQAKKKSPAISTFLQIGLKNYCRRWPRFFTCWIYLMFIKVQRERTDINKKSLFGGSRLRPFHHACPASQGGPLLQAAPVSAF